MTKKTLLLHPVILLCLGGILASFEAAGQSEAVLPAPPAAASRSARDELIRNGDFEGRFTARGVAHDWGAFGEGVVCKPNPRLGRVGGGIYGTEYVASGFGLYNSDYQTIRLHGKVNLVDASRFDLVAQLQKYLAEETITIAKLGAESFFGSAQKALAPDAY
ncbi:MAG: hypothetical protein JW810_06270, partial [Sedimentisphaerales bacterium]|nr:hypothetical protein [Sedimentisphaerales bacterium]